MNASTSPGSALPGGPPVLPVIPALDNTYGSVLIGVVIACGLWGIGTAQAYWYYLAYAKDTIQLKLLVLTVWSLDTTHQAMITHTVYYYLVTHYFDPLFLDYAVWSLTIQSVFEFLTCLCVQSFFLSRIWILSRGNYYLMIMPGLLILAKLSLSMVWAIKCAGLTSVTQGLIEEHSIAASINGCAAGADIFLATTMVYLLYKSRTGLKQSDSIVERLMVYSVNTGAITSLASIVTLITAEVWQRAYIYAVFYFCSGRLYTNTMLASLNARKSLRSQHQGEAIEMSGGSGYKKGPRYPGSVPIASFNDTLASNPGTKMAGTDSFDRGESTFPGPKDMV